LSSIYVDISFDKNRLETSKVTVHGRFVIRNVSYADENYKSTFEMEFGPTKLKQTATMANTSNLFTKIQYLYGVTVQVLFGVTVQYLFGVTV
jgi:hypothetical protein